MYEIKNSYDTFIKIQTSDIDISDVIMVRFNIDNKSFKITKYEAENIYNGKIVTQLVDVNSIKGEISEFIEGMGKDMPEPNFRKLF